MREENPPHLLATVAEGLVAGKTKKPFKNDNNHLLEHRIRGGNRERIVEHADKIQEKNQRTKKEKNASQQRAEAPAWWILNNHIA